LERHKFR